MYMVLGGGGLHVDMCKYQFTFFSFIKQTNQIIYCSIDIWTFSMKHNNTIKNIWVVN